jgi:hypothetical protein
MHLPKINTLAETSFSTESNIQTLVTQFLQWCLRAMVQPLHIQVFAQFYTQDSISLNYTHTI